MFEIKILVVALMINAVSGRYLVDDLEPGQLLSRFDYDYKMLQKMVQLEADVTKLKEHVNLEVTMTANCPDAWTSYNRSCYIFGHDDHDFIGAERFCVYVNSHLVNIETAEENSFLRSYLRDLKGQKYWIGMTDEMAENFWKHYPSQVPATFFAWGHGEPNQQRGANCVAIWESFDYLWVDEPCTNRFKPICKKTFAVD